MKKAARASVSGTGDSSVDWFCTDLRTTKIDYCLLGPCSDDQLMPWQRGNRSVGGQTLESRAQIGSP